MHLCSKVDIYERWEIRDSFSFTQNDEKVFCLQGNEHEKNLSASIYNWYLKKEGLFSSERNELFS